MVYSIAELEAANTMCKKTKAKKKGKSRNVKDVVTGSWSTQDGIELTFDVTSGNTPSKRYFAIADMDSWNGRNPERYAGYADSNSNGVYDSGIDKYTGTATVPYWDGTPRYGGTFEATRGILTSYPDAETAFIIPNNWFG